jgi:Undecaprenyl-phosphate glucose phosphotransferase
MYVEQLKDRLHAMPSAMGQRLRSGFAGAWEHGGKSPHISVHIISAVARSGEALLVALTGSLVASFSFTGPISPGIYLPLLIAAAASIVTLQHVSGAYTLHALLFPTDQIIRVLIAWSSVSAAAFLLLLLHLQEMNALLGWLVEWFLIGTSACLLGRWLFALLCRYWNRSGRFNRRAVLVGGGKPAGDLIRALGHVRNSDLTIVGIFDDRTDDRSPPLIEGYPRIGTIDELIAFARSVRVDLLLVTFPVTAENRLLRLLRKLWILPVEIRLSAHTQKLRYQPRTYSRIGEVPFIDLFDKPIAGWDALVKSVADKAIAALLILMLAPVMAAVWAAVKLDSRGPALFRQKRYGFNNELIEVYKFRSMFVDQTDHTARRLTARDDPRVTRVGRFIRKASLDELPQLFNVLKGELSMVGPRPHATNANVNDAEYSEIVEEYFARTRVKPGITGWAQVNGWRGNTDTVEKLHRRLEHDLYYIENWSLIFDLYILARTPFSLLSAENAY